MVQYKEVIHAVITVVTVVITVFNCCVMMSQNEDWKQMFGSAPIERSSLTATQKSKSPSVASGISAAKSEKELTQLLMSGSSTEQLTLTRSGSAGQIGMLSTSNVTSSSVVSVIPSVPQPGENTQRRTLISSLLTLLIYLACS